MKAISLLVICTVIIGCAEIQKSSKINKTEPIVPATQESSVIITAEPIAPIVILAMDKKVKTNLLKANYGWGAQVPILATSPKSKADSKWFVEFPVVIDEPGDYQFEICLSAKEAIPFDVDVNDNNVFTAVSFQNGKKSGDAASNFIIGVTQLIKGENIIKIRNDNSGSAPKITQFTFTNISK